MLLELRYLGLWPLPWAPVRYPPPSGEEFPNPKCDSPLTQVQGGLDEDGVCSAPGVQLPPRTLGLQVSRVPGYPLTLPQALWKPLLSGLTSLSNLEPRAPPWKCMQTFYMPLNSPEPAEAWVLRKRAGRFDRARGLSVFCLRDFTWASQKLSIWWSPV